MTGNGSGIIKMSGSKMTRAIMQTDQIQHPTRMDRTIAMLGSSLPMAIVLGVVPFEILVSLTGLVWLVSRFFLSIHLRSIFSHIVILPILGWFAAVIASRIFNGGTAYQYLHDLAFLRYPLFFMAMVDLSSRIAMHRYLIRGLLVGIGYALINLVSAHLVGQDFLGNPLSRYITKTYEGARIGAMCAYAGPFFLIWGVLDRNLKARKRLWIIGFGCVAMYLVISSQVRTALLASVFGSVCGYFALLILTKRIGIGSIIALLSLAGLCAWGVWARQPGLENIYDRVYFWKVSLEIWQQNPIFGVGISSYHDAYRQVFESGLVPPFHSPTGNVYYRMSHHAHNLYLQLLACNGIVGLGIFGWIFWNATSIIRSCVSSWHSGLWSWPFICLLIGLTGWNIYDPFYTTIVFYFLALIAVSVNGGMERRTVS
jgi:O-antigen ligase